MTSKKTSRDQMLAEAIKGFANALQTPNETDSNGESPAGVTDGLFEIARALRFVGRAIARNTCCAPGGGHEMKRMTGWDDEYSKCEWCGSKIKTHVRSGPVEKP